MSACDSEKIKKKHVILCEGTDAYYFLISMLNSNRFSGNVVFRNDIQVFNFGGNSSLQAYLETFRMIDGFEKLESILIIRDAESDFNSAVQQVSGNIKNAGYVASNGPGEWGNGNPSVGFLFFPLCSRQSSNGTLEDLCLSILSDGTKYKGSVDKFLIEIEKFGTLPRKFKNQLHSYFSATDKYVGMKIGEAAKANAFDWSSNRLDFLRQFILSRMGA